MKYGISIAELEMRMRPRGYSFVGFLGLSESLEAVLQHDGLTLNGLGISYEKIATELENHLVAVLEQRYRLLLEGNYPEYHKREKHDLDWHRCPNIVFKPGNLPSPEIGFLDGKFQIFFIQFRGLQECPWDCVLENTWSSFDFLLLNRGTGEYLTAPGLIVHLIREHHFFEGVESPYRVDPMQLAGVLGLVQ